MSTEDANSFLCSVAYVVSWHSKAHGTVRGLTACSHACVQRLAALGGWQVEQPQFKLRSAHPEMPPGGIQGLMSMMMGGQNQVCGPPLLASIAS